MDKEKRVIVFAHYDRNNIIEDYVLFYLKSLRDYCGNLIFVSTAILSDDEISKIKSIVNKVIVRDNVGYDFMSWQFGIKSIDNLECYDELIICNDSVYGPICSLDYVFSKMDKKDCDFWGLTDNSQFVYHLQSFFIGFRKKVICSDVFTKFWDGIEVQPTKMDIIFKYELGLSSLLINNGYKSGVYFEENLLFRLKAVLLYLFHKQYRQAGKYDLLSYLLGKNPVKSIGLNKVHFFWKDLLKQKFPFIKIELIRDNPNDVNIKKLESFIRNKTKYDIELIGKYLKK